ncbi:PilW family protein [Hahella sp. SMD15-11]|uniref:PilW family protein n=1 Tax=Thermohahella caldifontis TaxID=3142973 RepID=A0AB39V130_9GAMM
MKMMSRQRGVSLVELMVALLLGLFLIGGAIQVFLSGKQTYQSVSAKSEVSGNLRAAEYLLASHLHQAGYWDSVDAMRRFRAHGGFAEEAVLAGKNNVTATGIEPGTDELWVRFTGSADGSVQTCAGSTPADNQLVVEHFYVRPPDTSAGSTETEPVLMCEATVYALNLNTGVIGAQVSQVTVPLISGIEGFQVLYATGGASAQYVEAGSGLDWANVAGARFALLAVSQNRAGAMSRSTGFDLLGSTVTDPGDGHVRHVLQQVVSLRNRNPGV